SLGRPAGGADGQGHVGVLGVGEDEVLGAVRVGVDAGQFPVQGFLGHGLPQRRPKRAPKVHRPTTMQKSAWTARNTQPLTNSSPQDATYTTVRISLCLNSWSPTIHMQTSRTRART